uniref:Uncharacterized protein n=1 Tax=Arundo donax TaxID=35708 RepID=A0A0A9BDQ0_ARUDO
MEQLFLYCVLGNESKKHLGWQLIPEPEPEGQYHLGQLELMKLQFQIFLACSKKCHIVHQNAISEIPSEVGGGRRRQESCCLQGRAAAEPCLPAALVSD